MTLKFSSSESRHRFSIISQHFKIGDSEAEIEIFERLAEPLFQFVKRRLNQKYQSKFSAEDIVQATFISFFERHRREPFDIKGTEALWGLMRKIAIRKIASEVRKFQLPKRDVRKETQCFSDFDTTEFVFNGVSHEPDPKQRIEAVDSVENILSKLSLAQRRIVILKLRGHNNREIAVALQISERSVYRSLKDVRFHLKRLQQKMPAYKKWRENCKR